MPLNPLPPTALRADGIELLELQLADWPLEQQLSRVPDVVRWTFYRADMTEQQARERIELGHARSRDGVSRRYAVRLDGQSVGTAGIIVTREHPEVFYALLPEARGRGAATAAVRALSDWALDAGADQVVIWTGEGNAASEAVARRAGFLFAGTEVDLDHGEPETLLKWVRRGGGVPR
ncbi:GNAT family N-acetyltransferase [Kitasatospora sp. NPDC059747]|uniref:GNAT family N-acetyltransferase n=1 Tax=Kitasatospora sp. NPDC059747 TaxID=3346930 RepID=UPI003647D2E9